MKLTIYDFFEAYGEDALSQPSPERIRELTMKKIENAERKQSRKPLLRVAAVLAAALLLSVGAYAAVEWHGFASTEGLSQREIDSLMESAQSVSSYSVDAEGNVYYTAADGREIMLTAEEAAELEQQRQQQKTLRLQSAAGELLDISTLPLEPTNITAISTKEGGGFEDFMLGNGSMVILHPAEEKGYALHAGDTVTITLDSNDKCRLEFSLIKDGAYVSSELVTSQHFEQSFVIEEDGLYCFTAEYYSAAASNFTGGSITIS